MKVRDFINILQHQNLEDEIIIRTVEEKVWSEYTSCDVNVLYEIAPEAILKSDKRIIIAVDLCDEEKNGEEW